MHNHADPQRSSFLDKELLTKVRDESKKNEIKINETKNLRNKTQYILAADYKEDCLQNHILKSH